MLLCQPTRETRGEYSREPRSELFTRSFRAAGQADVLLCQPTRETMGELFVGERGDGELRGSRLEAWMKSHKSEVAIT